MISKALTAKEQRFRQLDEEIGTGNPVLHHSPIVPPHHQRPSVRLEIPDSQDAVVLVNDDGGDDDTEGDVFASICPGVS